ncbi:DUF3800 domain-containing protein [Mycobacteroides abscessus]|uniref:DUF3800 domain-containing protein n=1 Tax=Mycobacteroides abscessus TaxID=36809 RepID=UPI001300165D|nr:DUF3800 domain-containing protein [Mycobacteroides abscessus]
MHVFIDDSGCGGFKFGLGSSSHLVMAACVFRDPAEIQLLASVTDECRQSMRHFREFKYSATNRKVKDSFFDKIGPVRFAVRAIVMDKSQITSSKLRSSPSALKSYAVRMLLTKNYGQIRNAKVVIDGQDTAAFGISDESYLLKMVNREAPGTIVAVKFDDSRKNIGLQLADMVAGAINCGVRTHKKANDTDMKSIRARTYFPSGTLWYFC